MSTEYMYGRERKELDPETCIERIKHKLADRALIGDRAFYSGPTPTGLLLSTYDSTGVLSLGGSRHNVSSA